jgi:choline-glycine betaine transporter
MIMTLHLFSMVSSSTSFCLQVLDSEHGPLGFYRKQFEEGTTKTIAINKSDWTIFYSDN